MHEDYQTLIDEVTALLGTPATLENRDFGLIAFGAHDRVDDQMMDPVRTRSILRRRSSAAVRTWFESFGITHARQPVRIPPDPTAGVSTGRICLPVRHRGVVYGYIWLLDDSALDLTDPRLAEAVRTADRIGSLLATESRSGARRAALLRTLLSEVPEPGAVRQERAEVTAEFAAELGSAAAGPLALVAVLPWEGDGNAAPVPHLTAVAATCTMPATGSDRRDGGQQGARAARPSLAVLVRLRAPGVLDPAREVAERLLHSPRAGLSPNASEPAGRYQGSTAPESRAAPDAAPESHVAGRLPAAAGLGPACHQLADLPTSWRQALHAARAGWADPELGPVAEWRHIGPYRLLAGLPAGQEPDPAVTALLLPAHRELARTAEAFLDRAGQAGRTAAALGVHRQTLYYRLSRVTQLTGLDLGSGQDRLLLHMALKAARLGPL